VFCNGKRCKHEDWTRQPGYPASAAIRGLNSTWITPRVIAMQRPSTRLAAEFGVWRQMTAANVRAIFNLQVPGEHPICGDGNEPRSGFSYLPEAAMAAGVSFYNLGWVDMGVPPLPLLLSIAQLMDRHISARGEGVAVHCHAGYGRTGLVIAAWLLYARMGPRALRPDAAVLAVRRKRAPCIQTNKQVRCVREFAAYLTELRTVFGHDSVSLLLMREAVTAGALTAPSHTAHEHSHAHGATESGGALVALAAAAAESDAAASDSVAAAAAAVVASAAAAAAAAATATAAAVAADSTAAELLLLLLLSDAPPISPTTVPTVAPAGTGVGVSVGGRGRYRWQCRCASVTSTAHAHTPLGTGTGAAGRAMGPLGRGCGGSSRSRSSRSSRRARPDIGHRVQRRLGCWLPPGHSHP
jgi:hypothetical protein